MRNFFATILIVSAIVMPVFAIGSGPAYATAATVVAEAR
jgi:hypothetical protein